MTHNLNLLDLCHLFVFPLLLQVRSSCTFLEKVFQFLIEAIH